MSFLGNLFNVAKVGVGILNSVINQPPQSRNMYWVVELKSGKVLRVQAKFIAAHPNPLKVGLSTAGFAPPDEGEVSFSLATDKDGNQGLYAFNNSKNTDYYLSFTKTGGTGNTSNPQVFLAHADQPFVDNWAEVTGEFNGFEAGNVTVTPVQRPGGGTNLGNFGVNTVFANAVYLLYANKNGTINFSWTTTGTGTFNAAVVKNTTGIKVDVQVNLTWANPSAAQTLNFTSGAGTTTEAIPLETRPIDSVSISISSQDTTAAFVKEVVKDLTAMSM